MTFAHSAEVVSLKRKLEELEAENAALREKLSALSMYKLWKCKCGTFSMHGYVCSKCGLDPSDQEQKG